METTLERRVESLETDVSALKAIVLGKQSPKNWQSTFGMSRDDPGFEEMIRLGREIRESQREGDDSGAGIGH